MLFRLRNIIFLTDISPGERHPEGCRPQKHVSEHTYAVTNFVDRPMFRRREWVRRGGANGGE